MSIAYLNRTETSPSLKVVYVHASILAMHNGQNGSQRETHVSTSRRLIDGGMILGPLGKKNGDSGLNATQNSLQNQRNTLKDYPNGINCLWT